MQYYSTLPPRCVQDVEQDDYDGSPPCMPAEICLAACATEIVSAGCNNNRKFNPPPAMRQAIPQAEADVSRGVRPQRQIFRMNREIEQKMREHSEGD
jgi:hypothetical protein